VNSFTHYFILLINAHPNFLLGRPHAAPLSDGTHYGRDLERRRRGCRDSTLDPSRPTRGPRPSAMAGLEADRGPAHLPVAQPPAAG
jgi:hypothetical protein